MTLRVKLGLFGICISILVVGCSSRDPSTRPARPDNDPVQLGPDKLGKADGFDWGTGCKGGSGTFNQAIAKDAVVTIGTIPTGKTNVEIRLTSNEDVDIQLFDEDGTKVVQWPDGLLKEAGVCKTTYKGIKITWSGYNGDGTNLGHEYIKLEGVTQNGFTMKAYGYAAGQAKVDYKWDAKPDCEDSGSGSFTQTITKDAVVTVGTIPADLSDIKIQLQSSVDIDIQLFDEDGTKVVHWPDGLLKKATKESTTYKGVKITWSGYNGDGTGKGNEYIEIEGKTTCKLVMKVFGYEAGTATVNYSWGKKQDGVTAKVIFSPVSDTSKSHVAEAVKLIKAAQHSVDIAMYSLYDSRITDALGEAVKPPRNVKVRFVFHQAQEDRKSPAGTKSAELEEKGVDVRYASKSKVMHHKFMIVDGPRKDASGQVAKARAKTAWLATGSANWSGGAQTKYDENTLFLRGVPEVVLRYQKEFNRLWNDSYDFTWKTFPYASAATLDESTFPADANTDAYFTTANFKENLSYTVIKGSYKVSQAIIKELRKATSSIYVASGHYRNWPVHEELVKLKSKPGLNLEIKVYLDGQEHIEQDDSDDQESEIQTCETAAGSDAAKKLECKLAGNYWSHRLHKAGVALRFKHDCYRWAYQYAKQMHNKYIIIDKSTVITGSYNLSDNSERGSMENIVILRGGAYAAVAQEYVAAFDKMWKTDADGSLLAALRSKIQNSSTIPLVYPPMALSWTQVSSLKQLIRANCSLADSPDYEKNPQSHKTCPRNP